MLIIANLVFILFYLQVEPVFLPACLNKAIQITSVSSISATVLQYWSSLQPGSLHFYSDVFG